MDQFVYRQFSKKNIFIMTSVILIKNIYWNSTTTSLSISAVIKMRRQLELILQSVIISTGRNVPVSAPSSPIKHCFENRTMKMQLIQENIIELSGNICNNLNISTIK